MKLHFEYYQSSAILRKAGFAKGQIISKWFLVSWISSKKRTKIFDFTTMIPQVDLFSFVFLEEIKDTKKPFRHYLTFISKVILGQEVN